MNEIFKRVSVRNFKDTEVEDEKCEALLKAAMQAPSAGDQRPWEFIVVKDKETLNKLSKCSPYAGCVANAPMAIVVLGNDNYLRFEDYWQIDLGIAIENMLLEAVHLDLGGVFLGIAPLKDRMKSVRNVFNLPNNLHAFAIVPFGYPRKEEQQESRFDKSRIHYEIL